MRTFFLSVVLAILSFPLSAQDPEPRFSGDFQQEPLLNVLKAIETSTGYRFFFDEDHLDSVYVTISFSSTPLSQVLQQVLAETKFSAYIADDEVILTHNAIIVDNPKILQSFQEELAEKASLEKGLIFSREYQHQTDNQSDLENYVFEIGNRSQMQANEKATIAGYVREKESRDPIAGALVYIESPFTATSTDGNGFYSLTLPTGKHKILIQYVGMKTTQRNVVLFSNGKLNVEMEIDVIALQEVTVESDRDINVTNIQMGLSRISVEEVKTVPIVLGENDIMKIATTKAGVQTVGEGASGYNVRGGKADQNLILINDAPVYNSSHFFGFFSAFNSDAISSMELYKSGIPARFGGKLSSVFDIQARQASKTDFKGNGGISPVTSRLTLEIPLIKEKTGLLVGGRSTYSNWILRNIDNAGFRDNRVSFFDVILQLDHEIDEKNDLRVSSYISRDKFRLSSDTLFSFSNFSFLNANSSVKWNHRFNDSFDGSLTGVYAYYTYELHYDESAPNAFTQDFDISEASVNADLNYYIEETHRIRFGGSLKRYQVNPGEKIPVGSESIVQGEKVADEFGLESAIYVSDQYDIFPELSVYAGLRYVMFNALGPQDQFIYQAGSPKNYDTRIDSVSFDKGETIKTYHGPEFRLSGRYTLNEQSSLKLSYSRTRQYIHAMSNSASLSPTDTWRLSGMHLTPQTADQVSLGYYRNLFRNTLEASVETYYKKLQNLVDFKVGSTFLLNKFIERDILQGDGKSYGIELSLTKSGRLNGWVNYAYARTLIRLDGDSPEERINNGLYYPTGYDKPHTFNMVTNYKLTRRLSFSVNTTYSTGRPVTFPVAAFDFKGAQNIHFSDRNAFRIPDYFRVDLGINLEGNHRIRKLAHSFWSLSIYNLTGRDNPYSVFFDVQQGKVVGSQLIVFGSPIPTISYNFKF